VRRLRLIVASGTLISAVLHALSAISWTPGLLSRLHEILPLRQWSLFCRSTPNVFPCSPDEIQRPDFRRVLCFPFWGVRSRLIFPLAFLMNQILDLPFCLPSVYAALCAWQEAYGLRYIWNVPTPLCIYLSLFRPLKLGFFFALCKLMDVSGPSMFSPYCCQVEKRFFTRVFPTHAFPPRLFGRTIRRYESIGLDSNSAECSDAFPAGFGTSVHSRHFPPLGFPPNPCYFSCTTQTGRVQNILTICLLAAKSPNRKDVCSSPVKF